MGLMTKWERNAPLNMSKCPPCGKSLFFEVVTVTQTANYDGKTLAVLLELGALRCEECGFQKLIKLWDQIE